MKKLNANKILWVESWVNKADPNINDFELCAESLPNGKWRCEVYLPLINETVKSTSSTEVNAMLNASRKAAKLIDEYMKDHPELEITNEFKGMPYLIESDENGRYKSIGLSSEYRRKEGEKMFKEALKNLK